MRLIVDDVFEGTNDYVVIWDDSSRFFCEELLEVNVIEEKIVLRKEGKLLNEGTSFDDSSPHKL